MCVCVRVCVWSEPNLVYCSTQESKSTKFGQNDFGAIFVSFFSGTRRSRPHAPLLNPPLGGRHAWRAAAAVIDFLGSGDPASETEPRTSCDTRWAAMLNAEQ